MSWPFHLYIGIKTWTHTSWSRLHLPSHQQPCHRWRRSLIAGKRAKENGQKEGRGGKTHPELTTSTNPHKCLKFCKIYMLPWIMAAYGKCNNANKLSCKCEEPQPAFQRCWWQTWHHRARRKGRRWLLMLVLPFMQKDTSQYISHCFWRTPSKLLTWQDGVMQTQICTGHPAHPRTSAAGLVQFFVVPCSLNIWVCHIRPLKMIVWSL